MLEIITKDGKCFINEFGILGIQKDDYYPNNDNGYFSVSVVYPMSQVLLRFETTKEANEISEFIAQKAKNITVKNIADSDEGYVCGFKAGVEYALKIKDDKNV